MKVLVYPHSMEIGGSQLNAVELAGAVRDLGHEVSVVSEPGPMVETVAALGLEHLPIPRERRRPSPEVVRLLTRVCRERSIDIVHGHEWPPALEGFLGPRLLTRAAPVATVMSAAVAPFLPRAMSLVVGTETLAAACRAEGFADVTLIEPPVDVRANRPDWDPGDFRRQHGLAADIPVVAVVCRLVRQLKLEGLLAACQAVGALAADGVAVQLLIVGDGDERPAVEEAAAAANAVAGRRVVVLTGELRDPRSAYASADVMLGMGGSALRGMAFGKPMIVQGERGFWRTCTPDSVGEFLSGGWYGIGDGTGGAERLRAELEPLLASPAYRAELGAGSRQLVVDRFSLGHAARQQVEIYERAADRPRGPVVMDLVRVVRLLPPHKFRRRAERRRGTHATDDFNSLRAMGVEQHETVTR